MIKQYLESAPTPYVLGVNGGVFAVSFTDIEAVLKIALLILSIALTGVSLWLKLGKKR